MNEEEFIRVIDATPLVAIDLVILNERNEVLLGLRRNRPAQNWWFVPGGRIRKNEPSQDALRRIAKAELSIDPPSGKLLGVFDHFYSDNFYGAEDVTTHYVTFAYQIRIANFDQIEHDDQHAQMKWWSIPALQASDQVHPNTKLYFSKSLENGFRCEC